uniref:Bm10746 n=1 Tax=Brugia malayi TaxID=6279 RepID=A0A0J9Y0N5_BRUMA|nr:Bm10746 [Brugia malayi]
MHVNNLDAKMRSNDETFSGKRFTGRSGLSTSEPVTENDSNYFKLLEADGDSLLVGAR